MNCIFEYRLWYQTKSVNIDKCPLSIIVVKIGLQSVNKPIKRFKQLPEKSTIWVAILSGVTSAGIVISSALGGTSSGNSSLTKENMRDVFPTPALDESRHLEEVLTVKVGIPSPTKRIRTQLPFWLTISWLVMSGVTDLMPTSLEGRNVDFNAN